MQNSGIVKAKEKFEINMNTILIHAAGSDQNENKHKIPSEEINA